MEHSPGGVLDRLLEEPCGLRSDCIWHSAERHERRGAGLRSSNTLPLPVRTLVAVMNRWIGDCANTSKSMISARISRSGFLPIGFMV